MTSLPDDPAPFYAAHVFVCTNERPPGHPRGCCKDKDAEKLRNYMKVRTKELGLGGVRINTAGCLDRCELGPPMVIYPEGISSEERRVGKEWFGTCRSRGSP